MLKGNRDAVLRRIQPISIHGQMSWEIVFVHADDPAEQLNAARVGSKPSSDSRSSRAIASTWNTWSGRRQKSHGCRHSKNASLLFHWRWGPTPARTHADASPRLPWPRLGMAAGALPAPPPYLPFSILIVLSSIRLIGVSPFTGAFSIASTAVIPSTTRPKAVH